MIKNTTLKKTKDLLNSLSGNRALQLTLLSIVGLVSSFWQTVVKIGALANPEAPLSCNLSPVADCGVVLGHHLSAIFGFPNSLIGIVMFAMLACVGVVRLLGVNLNRRAKIFCSVLVTVMIGFAGWFFLTSLYIIGKICIFCVFIWVVSVPLFFNTMSEYSADMFRSRKIANFWSSNRHIFIYITFALAVALFFNRFSEYYF